MITFSFSFTVSALSITTDYHPLVVGIQNVVVCSIHENEPLPLLMEMILSETNETLAAANGTKNLVASLVPASGMNGSEIHCKAHANDGLNFRTSMTIVMKGLCSDIMLSVNFTEIPTMAQSWYMM